MITLAIDPGTTESAWVEFVDGKPEDFGRTENDSLLAHLRDGDQWSSDTHLVIEMIASYGMPVGAEVFQTCVWIGRFLEAWSTNGHGAASLLFRKDVKLHLCGQPRAKDGNIRQALIDKYGGKEKAIGKKNTPGPLYGIAADVWAALAVAVTFTERKDAA